jgi:hypothetical protein
MMGPEATKVGIRSVGKAGKLSFGGHLAGYRPFENDPLTEHFCKLHGHLDEVQEACIRIYVTRGICLIEPCLAGYIIVSLGIAVAPGSLGPGGCSGMMSLILLFGDHLKPDIEKLASFDRVSKNEKFRAQLDPLKTVQCCKVSRIA